MSASTAGVPLISPHIAKTRQTPTIAHCPEEGERVGQQQQGAGHTVEFKGTSRWRNDTMAKKNCSRHTGEFSFLSGASYWRKYLKVVDVDKAYMGDGGDKGGWSFWSHMKNIPALEKIYPLPHQAKILPLPPTSGIFFTSHPQNNKKN